MIFKYDFQAFRHICCKKKPFLVYVYDFATIPSVRLNILATTEKRINLFPTCMISALALAEKS
jgi:hypothetical protein